MPPLESLVTRIHQEMSGLRLTDAQACRLWQMDASMWKVLLEQLVRGRFLHKNEKRLLYRLTVRHRSEGKGATG